MTDLNILFDGDQDELLFTIQPYQREIVQDLISKSDGNYLEAADKWLNSSPANTAKFSTEQQGKSLYTEKLTEEIEKFLCGDDRYSEDRNKIHASTGATKQVVITAMAAAIGNTFGVAGVFLAPVILLIVMSSGKISLNAWCEMRKTQKADNAS